jgi:tetratricopeptide (TPR) repeat protein
MGTRLDSVLVVDYRRSLDGIPDEILGLLPLFDGCRSAREALRRARVPDAHAGALLERLRQLGVLCEKEELDDGEGPDLREWLAQRKKHRRPLLLAGAAAVAVAAVTSGVLLRHPAAASSAVAAVAPIVQPPPVAVEPPPVAAEPPPVAVAVPPPPAPVAVEPPPAVAAPPVAVAVPPPPAPPAAEPPADDYPKLIRDARALLDRGAYGKALDAANRAAQARPDSAEPYLLIGTVEQQKGRNPQAQAAYQRYLQLAPKGAYAAEIRAILRTLH